MRKVRPLVHMEEIRKKFYRFCSQRHSCNLKLTKYQVLQMLKCTIQVHNTAFYMKNEKAFSNDGANIQLVKNKGTNYEKVKLLSSVVADEKISKEDLKNVKRTLKIVAQFPYFITSICSSQEL